jgi:hypothetical protein
MHRPNVPWPTLLLLLAPLRAEAANLPADAAVFDELEGTRSAAMGGAHRGVGTSNDTLYLNPAGMALVRRYSVELNYGYSPFSALTHLNVSAVDSQSGPVAGGLSYTHTRGDGERTDPSLHRVVVAAAYALGPSVALGLSGRHIRGKFQDGDKRRKLTLYSGDVGVMVKLGEMVTLGGTAHNVIRDELTRMLPLSFGVGGSVALGNLVLAGDFVLDSRQSNDTLQRYQVGAEYFLGGAFPLRAGYYHAPFTDKSSERGGENVLTFGGGWVTQGGGIGVAAERSFERPRNWRMVASLQFFL